MEVIFSNPSLKDIYQHGFARKGTYGQDVVKAFIKKVDILIAAPNSRELMFITSLHFKKLVREKKYKGKYSVRVNDQYRIVFSIIKQLGGKQTIEIAEIEALTDYH